MLRSPTSWMDAQLPRAHKSGDPSTTTALTALLRSHKPVSFIAKGIIFREDDTVESVFLIASGIVCLYRHLPSGRRVIARFLFAGGIAGLSFDDEYPFTAVCITPSTVCKFGRSQFNAICAHSPALQNDVVLALKQELASEREDHMPMMHQGADARVARLLWMLACRKETDCGQEGPIRLSMSRRDIADYLGLTSETVCRSFAKLKEDGLISAPTPDRVWIKNVGKLTDLAEGY